MQIKYMSVITRKMQKYHKIYDIMYYINKNYALKYTYNDDNECINDTLFIDAMRKPKNE